MKNKKEFQVWFNKDGLSQLIARFNDKTKAETFINAESYQFETEGGTFEIIEEID
jgi:hypothetical protein